MHEEADQRCTPQEKPAAVSLRPEHKDGKVVVCKRTGELLRVQTINNTDPLIQDAYKRAVNKLARADDRWRHGREQKLVVEWEYGQEKYTWWPKRELIQRVEDELATPIAG